ncbi:adhesion G- coupled receptor D1-like, partial [Paramuricea clavata]
VNTSPTYHPTTVHPTKVNGTETSQLKEAEKIKSKDAAKKFLTEIVGEQIVVRNDSRGETNSAIKFTKLLEDIGLTLARNTLEVNESETVDTPSTFLLMNKPVSGFTFPSVEQQSAKKIDETISFPDDLVKTDDGVQRAFVCMAYSNLHENMASEFTISSDSFEPNTTFELNSKIIGAAVYPPLNKSLNNPITVTFSHAKISSGKQICSFWNHSIREWSTQGCELDEEHSTSTKTVCLCNHLTNFALLLQREGAPYSDPPLSLKIITIIGCTLSILACILCFIMFFTLKKKDIRHYLHINLAFAIAVAQLILLFGISQTKYEILCKAMAACLHYFYMVAFLLMLCEGVHLAILIETAFSHGELKLPVYLITSWGLPLIIVGITLGVRYDNYGGSIACFLSADQGTVYAFVGPFAFIMLINFAILVIVLRQVVRKTSLPISSKTASKFEIARATIRSLIILFPVMGFTWIFGILFFGFRTLALEYLFAIFCSLQGFFIFLFQYALNTENRSAFMRATRRLRLTFSSSTHSTSANGLKHTTETKGKISSPEPPQEEDSSTKDNCHLVLYRTVDDPAGGTIDSRTTSTFI